MRTRNSAKNARQMCEQKIYSNWLQNHLAVLLIVAKCYYPLSFSLPFSLSLSVSVERGGKSAQQLSTRRRRWQWRRQRRRWRRRRLLQSQEVSAPDNKPSEENLSRTLFLSLSLHHHCLHHNTVLPPSSPTFSPRRYRGDEIFTIRTACVRILFLFSFLLLLFLHLCNSTYYLANCTDYTHIHTHTHIHSEITFISLLDSLHL